MEEQAVVEESEEAERLKHKALETELELYPLNLIDLHDPVIKNEAMFDYHEFLAEDKLLTGLRFFADANTHWAESRDMEDLLMYTEFYFGFSNFQIGAETGSITGNEYLSIGPQLTHYDKRFFKRISLIIRLYPDFVIGYEHTTAELKLLNTINLSSTGMGRMVFPSEQTVLQLSLWLSSPKIKHFFIGVEYEYNNARQFNYIRHETPNVLFLGLKVELY